MTEEKKESPEKTINKENLEKFSWGRIALENYQNRDSEGAAYALAMYNGEGDNIHDVAHMYQQGLRGAVNFLANKYQESIGDVSIGKYLSTIGLEEEFGETGELSFSEIQNKLNEAAYIKNKKDSTPEEKEKAEADEMKYNAYLQLTGLAENNFLSNKKLEINKAKTSGLVKSILEIEKEQAKKSEESDK